MATGFINCLTWLLSHFASLVLWLLKQYLLNALSGILTCAASLLILNGLCQHGVCLVDTLPAAVIPFALGLQGQGFQMSPVTRAEMEERILRASHDDLGYRDYASYSAGARPIETLTSPTWNGPLAGSSEPQEIIRGKQARGPVWALKRDIQQGSCWAMAGTAGHLGIQLAEPIVITNLTVDHLPASLASETRSAPRHIRVWALVQALDPALPSAGPTPAAGLRVDTDPDPARYNALQGIPSTLWDAMPPATQLLRIADLTYDIYSPQHIQNTPSSDDAPAVSVDKVVFQFLDNWGLPDFTCIYRVRVHGRVI